ncbi:MAG TPA: metallophosphoesterase family protein [Haliangiales bacterium]|nr:metallophosphoesterase family protein [Haliangiales bacterium]
MLALLSDIHANVEALDACLEHARRCGATRYAFLGDLVGYGADPQRVVDTVMRYAADGAVVVKGNHDAAVAKSEPGMSDGAAEARDWTRGALDAAAKVWLAALPLCLREDPICFVHASAAAPARWEYIHDAVRAQRCVDAAGTTYTFGGHVHEQALYFEAAAGRMTRFRPVSGSPVPVPGHRRWFAIVGSAGQPRDGNPAAAYALFDLARATLTFHRVPYDHVAAARKIRAAGLPDLLSWRRPR